MFEKYERTNKKKKKTKKIMKITLDNFIKIDVNVFIDLKVIHVHSSIKTTSHKNTILTSCCAI